MAGAHTFSIPKYLSLPSSLVGIPSTSASSFCKGVISTMSFLAGAEGDEGFYSECQPTAATVLFFDSHAVGHLPRRF